MPYRRRLMLAMVLATAAALALAAGDAPLPAAGRFGEVRAALAQADEARVIVELTEPPLRGAERSDRAALRSRMAAAQDAVLARLPDVAPRVTYRYQGIPAFVAVVDDAALRRLEADPGVRSVVLDRRGEGAMLEAAALTNADDVRDTLGLTGAGSVAAVLDSGMDTDHPDFAGDILYQRCYLLSGCPGGGITQSGPGAAEDDHGHGSNVTGIITGNGVVAPKGVAPDVQIASYKILDENNVGFISDWIAAVDDIVANHPEVDFVNMSLTDNSAHAGTCDGHMPAMTAAINSLHAAGTLTFAASGNNGYTASVTFPACVTNAIAVGAVWDLNLETNIAAAACTEKPVLDKVACWSNSSSLIDVLAPGSIITSAGLAGGISIMGGTSMATPHALGVAAQLRQQDPALTPAAIETALESTGVPRLDPKNGVTKPRVDAYAAVTSISDADADGLPALGDNCPLHPNPGQENADRDFIDVSPPRPPGLDDLTRAMSDLDGDACDTDDDNDGIADAAEAAGCNGSGPLDPLDSDTDGDRVLDGAECALGSNPASAASKPPPIVGPDADADGLPDALEPAGCAALFDCDGDGFRDGIEFRGYDTLPDVADSDGDGCADGREIASVDGNRVVGASDLGIIAALFGNPGGHENMDLDKNGAIGAADLGLAAARFGPC